MRDVSPNMQDYQETYRNSSLEVPEYFNFAFDVVDKRAEDRTKLALISLDPSGDVAQHHAFWDLKVQSDRFANVLKSLG
ncbi:MAG: acyl-CoA synthetase, partial [Chloroflexi bacterium]|nr:acyl-CoA synthetase [Chloroflexota bacterium]